MDKEKLIDPGHLSYEQARDELVQIVKMLESGKTPLEETLTLWERGEALAARCHAVLSAAEQRIEQARAGSSPAHETPAK